MIIKPTHFEELCPNCHLSFGSKFVLLSYSMFPSSFYSDGYQYDCLFFTQCPYCRKFFSRKYFISQDMRLPKSKKLKSPDKKLIGRNDLFYGLQTPSFWLDIISNGLFYPKGTSEDKKENDLKYIYYLYWCCCNRTKGYDKTTEEYKQLVDKVFYLFNSERTFDKIIKAEILRQKGMFEDSMCILNEIKNNRLYRSWIEALIKANLSNNREVFKIDIKH